MPGTFESLAKRGSVHVFKDALLQTTEERDMVLSQLRVLESHPNYWVPRPLLVNGVGLSAAERVVAELYHRCIQPHVLQSRNTNNERGTIAGAEYWVQVYRNGRGLAFHVDKDEHAMKTRGEMINPIYSSVLYLTGGGNDGNGGNSGNGGNGCNNGNGQSKQLQSPTVITDERYDHETARMVPVDFPTESCLVFPKANRYLVFDGRAGHGVLDLVGDEKKDEGGEDGDGDGDVRVTFLVNWWAARPENVERDPEAAGASASASASTSASAADAVGLEPGCRPSAASKEPVYVISITKAPLYATEPLMIDDFLREQGILGDDRRPSPVIIRHSGVVMIPFRPEEADGDDDDDDGVARHLVDCALISQENHGAYL